MVQAGHNLMNRDTGILGDAAWCDWAQMRATENTKKRQGLRSICRGQAWSAGPGSGQAIQVPEGSAGVSTSLQPRHASFSSAGVYHAGLELSGVACSAGAGLLLVSVSLPLSIPAFCQSLP